MMLLQAFYYFVQSFQKRAILENGLQLIVLYDWDFK